MYFNLLGEGSSASKPKKRTAPADGDDNKKIKRTRTTYTEGQLKILVNYYYYNNYPDTEARKELSKETRMSLQQVQVRKHY